MVSSTLQLRGCTVISNKIGYLLDVLYNGIEMILPRPFPRVSLTRFFQRFVLTGIYPTSPDFSRVSFLQQLLKRFYSFFFCTQSKFNC